MDLNKSIDQYEELSIHTNKINQNHSIENQLKNNDINTKSKKIQPPVPPKSEKSYILSNQENQISKNESNNKQKNEEIYIKNTSNFKTTEQVKHRYRDTKKKRMNEVEAREKLKLIASPGDPNERYVLKDKLGAG